MKQMRRFREVSDFRLEATDGELGAVEDLYVDDRNWKVRYLVVRTGGWLLGRQVLIAPLSVREVDDTAHALRVNLTREQIEHSPSIDRAKPVSRAYEEAYYRHFGLPPYWDTIPGPWEPLTLNTGMMPPTVEQTASPYAPSHPYLRSATDMIGHDIRAEDGAIGHVEDLIVDDEDWVVRYIEVDTKNWLPGKKVLVQTSRIHHMSWPERSVALTLKRQAIESAPAYDPTRLITPDYEVQLFKHYGQGMAA